MTFRLSYWIDSDSQRLELELEPAGYDETKEAVAAFVEAMKQVMPPWVTDPSVKVKTEDFLEDPRD